MDDEIRVGATPREVIPGNVEAIAQLARRLQDIAVGCEDAAGQLRGLQASDWGGEAAEAFADALDQEPGKYVRAAEAFRDAAFAVERYATVLDEAQHDARRAIALFEEATARQARALAIEAARAEAVPGTIPPVEAETTDPDIIRARAIVASAREQVQYEADIAARRLSDAADAAPDKPGWGSRLVHGAGEFFGGVADATWGTGKFLWSVSQVRMVTDPQGWFHDVKGIGEGLVWGVAHPVEFAKAITDWDTWAENPARAAGRLVPDIALALATAGAGAAGRGARATERAADAAHDLRAAERAADAAEEARAAKRAADHQPRRSPTMDEQRRLKLQQDPDHNFAVRDHSIKEAELAEDLEAREILPGLERPAVRGQGDFVDPSGQHWDVKGPMSREAIEETRRTKALERGLPEPTFPDGPLRGQFEVQAQMASIRGVIKRNMKVILDTRGLNETDFRALQKAVEQEDIGDRILWYP